jgi:hypothetical protein
VFALNLPNPSGTQTYTVKFNGGVNADNNLHMVAAGNLLDVMPYNPEGDWSPAWDNEFCGETLHRESDVPGTADDVTSWSSLHNQRSSDPTDWGDVNTSNLSVAGLKRAGTIRT